VAVDSERAAALGDDDVAREVAALAMMMVDRADELGPVAGLDTMAAEDRGLLLETFGAWLDCGGSADEAAKQLFVHPNTVRYRLRRLEERTGRSMSDPRWIAELTLAYEIDRRLSGGVGGAGRAGGSGGSGGGGGKPAVVPEAYTGAAETEPGL
jgi:hypothetical protein